MNWRGCESCSRDYNDHEGAGGTCFGAAFGSGQFEFSQPLMCPLGLDAGIDGVRARTPASGATGFSNAKALSRTCAGVEMRGAAGADCCAGAVAARPVGAAGALRPVPLAVAALVPLPPLPPRARIGSGNAATARAAAMRLVSRDGMRIDSSHRAPGTTD